MLKYLLYVVILCIAKVTCQIDFDVLKETVNNVLDVVQIASENYECTYQCPIGYEKTARRDYIPSSNGCGSLGVDVDLSHLPSLVACCDSHDVCYDTCNSNRKSCDEHFHKCLMHSCSDASNRKKTASNNVIVSIDVCKITAEVVYQGVSALGCKPFLDAQKKACICHPKQQTSRMEL